MPPLNPVLDSSLRTASNPKFSTRWHVEAVLVVRGGGGGVRAGASERRARVVLVGPGPGHPRRRPHRAAVRRR